MTIEDLHLLGVGRHLLGVQPVVWLATAGVVFLVWLAHLVRGLFPAARDPQRLFSAQDRRLLARWAGGRCENKRMWWRRCPRQGRAADHVHPWSKGGPTVVSNGAWLCTRCNSRKSDKVPSRFWVWRLHRRRRSYYPPDALG